MKLAQFLGDKISNLDKIPAWSYKEDFNFN